MPVPKPNIVAVPSTVNMYPNRNGIKPEAVVLHIAEGTIEGCDSWFSNPAAQAGAHFCVAKDGRIHQYYTVSQAPWANGAIESGYTAQLINDNGTSVNPNYWTVSVEHEGHSGDIVPDAQYKASIGLTAFIFENVLFTGGATDVAVDRKHILRHGDISPLTRPNCPGWSEAFIAKYITDVKGLLAAGTVQTQQDPKVIDLLNALTMSDQSLRTIQSQLNDLQTKARMAADGIDAVIKKYKG